MLATFGRTVTRLCGAALLFTALCGSAAPARAQGIPLPRGGSIQDTLAWNAAFNRWLGEIGDLSAYGVPRVSQGGVQDALRRNLAVKQWLAEIGRPYGVRVPGPLGMSLQDMLDYGREVSGQVEGALAPGRNLNSPERLAAHARVSADAHARMARYYELAGEPAHARVYRQWADYYSRIALLLASRR